MMQRRRGVKNDEWRLKDTIDGVLYALTQQDLFDANPEYFETLISTRSFALLLSRGLLTLFYSII